MQKERAAIAPENGKVFSATVFLKKQTLDGTWHEIEACAYYSEYAPPVTKSGYENPFWKDKPHIMLAKCAESLALRMAFPNELSSLRTREEMEQAVDNLIESKPIESCISELQSTELMQLLDKCSIDYQNTFNDWLTSKSLNSLQMLPQNLYLSVKKGLSAKAEENQFAGLGHESTGTE